MKRFLLLTSFLMLLFSSKSLAFTQQEIDYFQQEYYAVYQIGITDTYSNQILTQWASNSNYHLYSFTESPNFYEFMVSTDNNRLSGTTLSIRSGDPIFIMRPSTSTDTKYWNNTGSTFNVSSGTHSWGTFEEFMSGNIDFDTVYYSAIIPTPNLQVDYNTFTSTNAPEVPLSVYIPSTDSEIYNTYYLEMQVQFAPVTTVGVSYGGRSGGLTFSNASSRGSYVNYDVIKNTDMIHYGTNSTTTTVLRESMSNSWDQCLTDYSPSENLNYVFYQNLTTHLQETAKTKYESVRTKQCMFGNYMRVWARYFTIDSENRYIVGAWKVWECYDSGTIPFDDTLPDYYVPYSTAVGQTTTFTDTDANENQNLPTGQGTPTTQDNPNNTVTVINNVPNYPDYPTIASYNHDNILVQFIDTAKYLPTFFGDYSAFLVDTFAFIPSAVWSVISLGFLASIVIMIIKVL